MDKLKCPVCSWELCWCPHWCKCTLVVLQEYKKNNPEYDITRWEVKYNQKKQTYLENITTEMAWWIYWQMFHLLTYLNADKKIFIDLLHYYPCDECRIEWMQLLEWMYQESSREDKIKSMIEIHDEINKKLWKQIWVFWVDYRNKRLSIKKEEVVNQTFSLWERPTKLIQVNWELVRIPI